jgi:hypothetical protein
MGLPDEQLRKLIDHIFVSHLDGDMDCESCGCQLECLAEKVAAGASLSDLLPEVEAHIRCCRDCREEWQALLCILRAERDGSLSTPQN